MAGLDPIFEIIAGNKKQAETGRKKETLQMIVRTWRGLAATDEAAKAYAVHVEKTAFPKMRKLGGHIGASLVTKITDEGIIMLVTSYWQDMQAIQQFSGETVETAVVEPRAQAVLDSFDLEVEHFELVVKSGWFGN